jgi:hypothetical protein
MHIDSKLGETLFDTSPLCAKAPVITRANEKPIAHITFFKGSRSKGGADDRRVFLQAPFNHCNFNGVRPFRNDRAETGCKINIPFVDEAMRDHVHEKVSVLKVFSPCWSGRLRLDRWC